MLLLANDYGLEATSIVMHLLSRIYANGYYIQWDERRCKVFATSLPSKIDGQKVMSIVDTLIRENYFDKNQYKTNGILTNEEIQGSYAIVSKKRKKMPKIKPEYSLLPPEEAKKEDQKQQQSVDQESKDNLTFENDENRDKNTATTNKTDAKIGKSDAKPGQIKEKEIKEKKTKENIILGRGSIARTREENARLEKWKKEMLEDEDWCATLVRFSGKGLAALEHAAEAIEIFFDLLLLRDEKAHQESLKEFKLHFVSWWRYNNFTMDMNELRTGKKTLPTRRIERRKPESKFETMEKTCAEAQKMVKEMMGL